MIEGLYVHIPFCAKRCYYCDFNTYEGQEALAGDYVEALKLDLKHSWVPGPPLGTLFLGGGTPSILSADLLQSLLNDLRHVAGFQEDAELSMEVNPGTANLEKFQSYRSSGINRLSFGFQAKQDPHLKRLGRIHTAAESEAAWTLARRAGYKNMSLDLMFGLPEQTMEEWKESLSWALEFQPEHISFYGLTVEAGTPFYKWQEEGKLSLPDEGLEADMYAFGIEMLKNNGFEHYEISNFAKPGYESKHNQLYWKNRPCLGLGAGAWSYVEGRRFAREKNPRKYIEELRSGKSVALEAEELQGRKAEAESLYLGLRMMQGIELETWAREHGGELLMKFGAEAKSMINEGLLEISESHLRLTPAGIPLSNRVFSAFL